MPLSNNARTAASVCAGVGLLWHQSTSVVAPKLIWFSAPRKRGDVDVLRPEQGRKAGMHAPEIFGQRPVRCKAAQRGLPGVHVGID